jgi:hypothetical protein
VVEEQSRVEVIIEIDAELEASLLDRELGGAGGFERLILRCAPLALAHTQVDPIGTDPEQPGQCREDLTPPPARILDGNVLRRCILLHVQVQCIAPELEVAIDREGVLGHVGVVKPIALHLGSLRSLAESLTVLLEPIGEHARPGAVGHLGRRRTGAILGLGAPGGSQIEAQQSAGNGAVPEFVHAVAAQPQLTRRIAARQHRSIPAPKVRAQRSPQCGVHRGGFSCIPEPLAIGRIGAKKTRRVAERSHLLNRPMLET